MQTVTVAVLLLVAAVLPAVGVASATAGVSTDGATTAAVDTTATHNPATMQAACTYPFTATDATGTEVTVDERPERVTTLGPSAAQTMWEIGGKSQVVGVTQYAGYLDDADSRTNVSGSGFGASVETVVGTNPDLVLAPNTSSASTVQALRDAGVTVFHFSTATTVDDVREKTTLIGRLTGNCEGAAEANAWMTANVETAGEATAEVDDVRALYPLGGGYVAGSGTFISAMIDVAGGTNVAAERDLAGYPQVSDEVIVDLAPTFLVLTETSAYLTAQEPYASTPAVQNGDTVQVNNNWMNQPAPRSVVLGVRTLTRGFHPDATASVEFETRAEAVAAMGTPTPTPTATAAPAETTAADTEEPTETSGPGFGVVLAVLTVLGSALLASRER